jgi:hypothetical protein
LLLRAPFQQSNKLISSYLIGEASASSAGDAALAI